MTGHDSNEQEHLTCPTPLTDADGRRLTPNHDQPTTPELEAIA